MITQVLLLVAYGGCLEIYPHSFQLMISLYMEGEETKNSGSDRCRVNMSAFFRDRAKASQAARSKSLHFNSVQPPGRDKLPPSFDYHPSLAGKVRAL